MAVENTLNRVWDSDAWRTSALGIPPTGSVCPCLWRSPGLVDQQRLQEARPGKTNERGRVQTVTGADLGERSASVVEAHKRLDEKCLLMLTAVARCRLSIDWWSLDLENTMSNIETIGVLAVDKDMEREKRLVYATKTV